jgi:hypothetical protein
MGRRSISSMHFGAQHQKVLCVLGEEGLICLVWGIDFNSDRVQELGNGSLFHDIHCRIRGSLQQRIWYKSTLITFIRRIFFGILNSRFCNLYLPLKGRQYGGRLVVNNSSGELCGIKRNTGRKDDVKVRLQTGLREARPNS